MKKDKLFYVEQKNNEGTYEPVGVLSLKQIVQIEFSTKKAVRFVGISNER